MSRVGRLYVGAAYAGHLLCFDPAKDALEDLGAIHPGAASFPCRMDEDDRGRIWIGSYPAADLTCYDPVSREFVRYGRMDDVDMYDYPFVGSDGTVASLVQMTRPHVVTLDPQTRQKQTIGPLTTRGKESIDLCQAKDGRLYIRSSRGNFRIDGMKAVPVDVVPIAPAPPTLPGVRSFAFADAAAQVYRKLEVRKTDGTVRMFTLEYTASGSDIFCLHAGPDGCVYGSSYLPLHLFRYRPQGTHSSIWASAPRRAGKPILWRISRGRSTFPPTAGPCSPCSILPGLAVSEVGLTTTRAAWGRMDDISCRPRSTLAGPLGRIWVASVPDYGRWGGPLTCYDPATGKKTPYYRIVGDGSCYTLAHLEKEKLLAVGTSVDGGSGTQPKVGQAVLFLWDYQAERKVWEGTLDRPVSAINALLAGSDGRLYGTVVGGKQRPELFVFDSTARALRRASPCPPAVPWTWACSMGRTARSTALHRTVSIVSIRSHSDWRRWFERRALSTSLARSWETISTLPHGIGCAPPDSSVRAAKNRRPRRRSYATPRAASQPG